MFETTVGVAPLVCAVTPGESMVGITSARGALPLLRLRDTASSSRARHGSKGHERQHTTPGSPLQQSDAEGAARGVAHTRRVIPIILASWPAGRTCVRSAWPLAALSSSIAGTRSNGCGCRVEPWREAHRVSDRTRPRFGAGRDNGRYRVISTLLRSNFTQSTARLTPTGDLHGQFRP
jgi:hypothetical protein